ncbi:MAG TPA: hypothetical protein VIC24_15065 [Gemmatimonadaceae bacterium]|jgi:hypothetical protein
MRESTAFHCGHLRTIGIVVAVAMGAIVTRATGQAADSSVAASPFHIAAQARGPLHELWEHSVSAKQERVACLGGRIDHDVVYITRVELLAPSRADSANISARASLRECSAPTWLGTVHTHIATFHGLPYTIFSAPDRYVMMLWREKWKAPGVFCILYSDMDANCELGNTVSGHVQYEYAKGQSIGS